MSAMPECKLCGKYIHGGEVVCNDCSFGLLTSSEIYDVLQAEIVWCLENTDPHLNHDQRMGFVNGLRQAQILIFAAQFAKDETE